MRGVVSATGAAVLGALAFGFLGDSVSTAQSAASRAAFTPVVASILGGETAPVSGSDGRSYVVYELLFTNAKRIPAQLLRLEVVDRDTGGVVKTLEGESLVSALRNLNVDPVEDTSLGSSESRVALITLEFAEADDAPARITHRLNALAASSPASREPTPVQYHVAPLDISRRSPPVLEPPLKGTGWLAINGCCDGGGAHRASIQTVNGKLWDAQRFAIDWMRVDDERRLFVGDPKELRSYAGYGEPVHAAAAGTVVRAVDGLEDQVPGQLPDPSTITLENVDGNSVVLDHGGGVHTLYAHLRKGSLRVRAGDGVGAGQPLALLGNTGNTSAPHLHFHVMTGTIPLGSDGIPFVNPSFTTSQRIDDDEFAAALFDGAPLPSPRESPRPHEDEMPLNFDVITFP